MPLNKLIVSPESVLDWWEVRDEGHCGSVRKENVLTTISVTAGDLPALFQAKEQVPYHRLTLPKC